MAGLVGGKWEGLEQHGAESLRRKGIKNWDERIGKRLVKLWPTALSGEDSLKPCVPVKAQMIMQVSM